MITNNKTPLEIAFTALESRGRLLNSEGKIGHGEASLINLVADIVDGVLEGERMDLRLLKSRLPSLIRNTPHSCQTEEHCCALHAAHKAAAERVEEVIQELLEQVGGRNHLGTPL